MLRISGFLRTLGLFFPPSSQPSQGWAQAHGSEPKVGQRYFLLAHTRQGTGYLSLLTDTFPRRIVSHYVHANLHMADCLAALYRAARGVGRAATRCIHYSGVVPFGVASTPQIHLLGGAEKGRTALLDDRRP